MPRAMTTQHRIQPFGPCGARGVPTTMARMFPERRASPREPLSLPIKLAGGASARTRDISEHGLFLFVPRGETVDEWLSVEFAVPQAGLKFDAVGEVVRIEPGIRQVGVAIRLHRPRLVPLD